MFSTLWQTRFYFPPAAVAMVMWCIIVLTLYGRILINFKRFVSFLIRLKENYLSVGRLGGLLQWFPTRELCMSVQYECVAIFGLTFVNVGRDWLSKSSSKYKIFLFLSNCQFRIYLIVDLFRFLWTCGKFICLHA